MKKKKKKREGKIKTKILGINSEKCTEQFGNWVVHCSYVMSNWLALNFMYVQIVQDFEYRLQ